MGEPGSRDILRRHAFAADLIRYGLSAVVVVSAAVAAALALSHLPPGEVASETEDAVLLEMSPALASSAPPSEATEGPEQQASEAAAPVAPTEQVPAAKSEAAPKDQPPSPEPQDQPFPVEKPEIAAPPRVPSPPESAEPPVAAKLPEPQAAPPPVAAAPAQEAMAPAGSQTPVADAPAFQSEAARRRAAHALSRWQQALLSRLEGARTAARSDGETGTVTLAFTIDRQGRLVGSRIAHASGSPRLDRAALALLGRAAPFPPPPPGSDDTLSFTVPIAFARR